MAASRSLASLLRQTTLDDHEEVLRAANAVLKKSKDDREARKTKIIALLKLDRYEDALDAAGEGSKDGTELPKAYALYKVGRYDEAELIAKSLKDGRGIRHVEAQAVGALRFPLKRFSRSFV